MHSVRRVKPSAEQRAAKRAREAGEITAHQQLLARILKRDQTGPEALARTTTLLTYNPDHYTVWNIRREIVAAQAASAPPGPLLRSELQFTQQLLPAHPKVYWIWNHRRWVLDQLPPGPAFQGEMLLTTKLLERDARNFHGWGYRWYVLNRLVAATEDKAKLDGAKDGKKSENGLGSEGTKAEQPVANSATKAGSDGLKTASSQGTTQQGNGKQTSPQLGNGAPADPLPGNGKQSGAEASDSADAGEVLPIYLQEFAFTTKKINENFSNYSAWHYRAQLIPRLGLHRPALTAELDYVFTAVSMDPADQSGWLYFQWLLDSPIFAGEVDAALLEEQRAQVAELLDEEPCVWAARTLSLLNRRLATPDPPELGQQMAELDPMRRTRYLQTAGPN